MKPLVVFTFNLLLVSVSFCQELPGAAVSSLDARFGDWALLHFQFPKGVDSSECFISPHAGNVLRCDLNGDSIPDYAVALETVHNSVWFEYFVGVVAREGSFQVFVADSAACDGCNQMTIAPANSPIPYFDTADEDLSGYGKISADKMSIVLPTDCIVVTPIVESHTESTCVFFHHRFVAFPSAD